MLVRGGEDGPVVDRSTIVTDVARRGDLERSIAAAGTLASEDLHVVSAIEPGTVAEILVKPGTRVRAGDVIARLENSDLEAAAIDARSAVDVANALLASASSAGGRVNAAIHARRCGSTKCRRTPPDALLETLHRSGLVADSTYRIAQIKAGESKRQVSIGQAQRSVGEADQTAKTPRRARNSTRLLRNWQLANHKSRLWSFGRVLPESSKPSPSISARASR